MAAGGVPVTPLKLQSSLAGPIQNFINLSRLSGTDYKSQARLLVYFDRFLLDQNRNVSRITRQITDSYQQSLSHLAPRTRSNRFCVVRQLCKYLARRDSQGYVPEALALNLEHFHSAEQRLYIAEGKFQKARLVPLSASTCKALQQYVHRRLKMTPRSADSPFFLNERSRRLHQCTVNQTFRSLLRQCGIHHTRHTGPSIHDLRHTFAVDRLLAWYRDGQEVNARLPWLATYMGHVDVHSTQVYLQATPELIEQVDRRFHNQYLFHGRNLVSYTG
jgi:site-specific recombinase XerD